ncbi:MAG: RNA-binding protein [Candidatus Aminicenantales bacterium]
MVGQKVYVGNLYVRAKRDHLKKLFSRYGDVIHVELIEGSGFGFVEMSNQEEAEQAVRALDGTEFLDRVIKVK